MTQIQKKPEWYLVIGLIVSVIFILISVLQNQYTTSILIGIISILVTYLIDLTVKLKDRDERLAIQVNDLGNKIVEISKKSQEEILESVQEEREKITETVLLGEELAEDEELRHIIKDLVDKSEAVKKLNIDAFSKYARNLLEACRDQINDLSDGEEEIPAQYNFVPLEACHLPSHMYIVLSHDPSYLKGRYGTTYLNEQQETIKKNRSITMIWIQPKHILSDPYYKDFILKQEQMQVDVFVAEQEEIPSHLHRDLRVKEYGLVDEEVYFTTVFDHDLPDKYKVSTNRGKVNTAMKEIKILLNKHAQKASDYYK